MNYLALRTRNHCIPEADESWIVHKNAKKTQELQELQSDLENFRYKTQEAGPKHGFVSFFPCS